MRGRQPRPHQLAGHTNDRCRRNRTGMHVQTNTRTLTKHRGLPRMSDRPSRQPSPSNPRTCVREIPARNHSPKSSHVIPSSAMKSSAVQVAMPRSAAFVAKPLSPVARVGRCRPIGEPRASVWRRAVLVTRAAATDRRCRTLRLPHRVVDPSAVVSDSYTRGAPGRAVSARRVAGVLTAAGIAVLMFLVIVLTVSAVGERSRASRLSRVGVPVTATVTGCVGRASGTGITTVGYTCRGVFTLAGQRHEAVIGGSSKLLSPGAVLAVVADPRHPSVLVSARSVTHGAAGWTEFIAPALLFVLLLGIVVTAAWRLGTTTAMVAVLTRQKSRR
jgi:hypothetical protein